MTFDFYLSLRKVLSENVFFGKQGCKVPKQLHSLYDFKIAKVMALRLL